MNVFVSRDDCWWTVGTHGCYSLCRTFFPDANEVVRLEFGEFLLHPGSLVHAGMNISGGTRHLLVIFADTK